jgi:hypothetical protein
MTGSSVAHGLAGGVHLKDSMAGMDAHFEAPKEGHPITPVKSTFPPATHNYAGGMQGAHVVHNVRI